MSEYTKLFEQASARFQAPDLPLEGMLRRRDRKKRNQRIAAATLAIVVSLVSVAALIRSFRPAEIPASPTKPPGIFSEVGGWITYGDEDGIWAVDPLRPNEPNGPIQLSADSGTPLAWSSDGSKLLVVSDEPPTSPASPRLFVLNADGTKTTLTRDWCRTVGSGTYCGSGGSFSPDGSQVIYAAPPEGTWRSSIFVVDAEGGTPRVLRGGDRRWYAQAGISERSWLSNPTFSPDGSQIAYFDHQLDGPSQLRVMNADGTGARVLRDGTGYHISNLVWSPDGGRLYWGESPGIYVVEADGSGFALAIPEATNPYWSPDGSRIAFQHAKDSAVQGTCNFPTATDTVSIADPDGKQVQEFGFCAKSGPWNPLIQPEQD